MLDVLNDITGPLALVWKYKLLTIAGIKLSVGNLLVALTMLLFSTRLSKIVVGIINKRLILPFVNDQASQNTYRTFAFYGALSGFVTLSLTIAGIPLTIFTVVGGALAIGVGFGSQNIVNNFISGIILMVERPIRIGDTVEVDGVTGEVTAIGTRSTKIKTLDHRIFIVPNSFFLEKGVTNWNFETNVLRNIISFGVSYGSEVRLVENACMDILLNTPGVEQTPVPRVIFDDFADSSLNFKLIYFIDTTKVSSGLELRSDIRFQIMDKFRQLKIEMPFPQRDVHLRAERPLSVKVIN